MSNIQERDVMLEPWFSIQINGRVLGYEFLQYVQQVQVEEEEDKLPLCSIVILDPKMIWLNDAGVMKGSKIRVSMGHRKNHRQMFYGKVTHVDADYPDTGDPSLVIVAIDRAINLMDVRKARSFKNAKVSDVVKILLKECGLDYVVEDTGAVIDHIPQESESDLEFITRWRKKLGWKFRKLGSGAYYFGKGEKKTGRLKELGYKTGGLEIVNFTPSYQDQETQDAEESDTDNNGDVAEYTVRNTKNVITYPGINDTSSPIGRA